MQAVQQRGASRGPGRRCGRGEGGGQGGGRRERGRRWLEGSLVRCGLGFGAAARACGGSWAGGAAPAAARAAPPVLAARGGGQRRRQRQQRAAALGAPPHHQRAAQRGRRWRSDGAVVGSLGGLQAGKGGRLEREVRFLLVLKGAKGCFWCRAWGQRRCTRARWAGPTPGWRKPGNAYLCGRELHLLRRWGSSIIVVLPEGATGGCKGGHGWAVGKGMKGPVGLCCALPAAGLQSKHHHRHHHHHSPTT